ncbi:MAG: pyridoxal phosphate-dependent aminotransferase [Oscillospiraceae bacterium]
MKPISLTAQNVHASTTLVVDAVFKQMKADGKDVVGFGAGEPDFETPDSIKAAGILAIRDGKTRYTPAAGIIPLRKAIAERLRADCGLEYDYTQIVVASGAKHNVFVALATLLDPGDEVIVPAPYWVSYVEMVRMLGAVPVVIEASEQQGFKITPAQLDAAVTPKTKLLMLNNPSNPTGMFYNESELRAIAEVCTRRDLYVVADEIYEHLLYDSLSFTSFAALGEDIKDRTVLINGVSKAYAMTGWRVGYAAASKEIATAMSNYLSHSTGAPSTISQWAATEALGGPQDTVESMRLTFEARRNYMVERMNSIEGVSCLRPQGAFYVMMNIEKQIGRTLGGVLINNDDDFAVSLLQNAMVAVVPCSGFGAPGFVRWTYATSIENIKEGLDRLENFLRG